MSARKCHFAFLLAVLGAAIFPAMPHHSIQLGAAPPADKFEDFAQFHHAGGVVSATGIRDKGGFTVVSMEAVAGRSKLSVSFAVKEDQKLDASDFRVVAVDAAGKRHPGVGNKTSAGGDGIMVITVVAEFNIDGDKIDALVIQQRALDKK